MDYSKKYSEYMKEKIIPKLKSPSTATFPEYDNSMLKEEKGLFSNKVFIETYVDSQNGFGAMIRTAIRIKIDSYGILSSATIKPPGEIFWSPFFKKGDF